MHKLDPVVQVMIDKTLEELNNPSRPKPVEHSRISKTPNGYVFLVAWSNASLLRVLNRRFCSADNFGIHKLFRLLQSQFD